MILVQLRYSHLFMLNVSFPTTAHSVFNRTSPFTTKYQGDGYSQFSLLIQVVLYNLDTHGTSIIESLITKYFTGFQWCTV